MATRIAEFFTAEAGGQIDQAVADEIAIAMIYAGEENDQMSLARRVRKWITDNRKPADDGTDDGTVDDGAEDEYTPGGERGRIRITLANWFSANGLVVSSEQLDTYIDQIQSGASTLDELKQWYRDNHLAVTYSGYADDFARGMDASEIAMDFRSVMANLLERTIEDIDFDDPLVQRAMQRRGEDGKPRPMTRYEFEQEVRGTSDWQKTDNAMSMYTDIGEGILRSFGFRG